MARDGRWKELVKMMEEPGTCGDGAGLREPKLGMIWEAVVMSGDVLLKDQEGIKLSGWFSQ
jgi:hypothetical protein